ncbi:MAG: peroxiredoxin [Verrucomicrobia bacterium]|nr:MAG: peroxiredoxin [Verrucomicrobiota bacterium]
MSKSILFIMAAAITKSLFGSGEPLEVGAPAPDVTALNQDGESISLGDLYQKGLVLVYFYPKADTPGCTKQACSLRDAFADLSDRGVIVVGVSSDKPAAQKKFREKYHLPFTLMADSDLKIIDAFGVPTRVGGFAARQAFLIQDSKIVWRDLKASTAEQAVDVLAALDAIENG